MTALLERHPLAGRRRQSSAVARISWQGFQHMQRIVESCQQPLRQFTLMADLLASAAGGKVRLTSEQCDQTLHLFQKLCNDLLVEMHYTHGPSQRLIEQANLRSVAVLADLLVSFEALVPAPDYYWDFQSLAFDLLGQWCLCTARTDSDLSALQLLQTLQQSTGGQYTMLDSFTRQQYCRVFANRADAVVWPLQGSQDKLALLRFLHFETVATLIANTAKPTPADMTKLAISLAEGDITVASQLLLKQQSLPA